MLIKYKTPSGKKSSYNVPKWTAEQLDNIKKLITEKDRDYVIIIEGDEGAGKSMLACQFAYYVDPTFTQERMCLTPEDFTDKVSHATKTQAVVFDEAYTGLSSTATMSTVNRLMIELLMEMRKRNLFIILCIPSVFYLSRYVALHRARGLFRTYFSKGNRGQYVAYNKKNLRKLYINGRKKMSYAYPTVHIFNRFPNRPPIDWEEYENRKIQVLKDKRESGTRGDRLSTRFKVQRDKLMEYIYKNDKLSYRKISNIVGDLTLQEVGNVIRGDR